MVKRLIVGGLLSAFLVVSSTFLVQSASAAPQVRPFYLALGDSLAVGSGASVPSRFGFVGLLEQYLRVKQRGAERFVNLAIGGEDSTTFINGGQLMQAEAAINDMETHAQVISLSIGGNNFLPFLKPGGPCATNPADPACQTAVAQGLATFAHDYPVILQHLNGALQNDPGQKQVMVMTLYNAFGGTNSVFEPAIDAVLLGSDGAIDCAANQSDPRKAGLNDLISCIGRAYGVTVVDVYPLFGDNALALTHIAEGDIHPNNAGYAVIADGFIAALHE